MRQTTLCEGSFAKRAKQTRKEKFLLRMARIIPWDELSKAIEPRYPKPEGSGRRHGGGGAHVGVDSQSKLIHSAAVRRTRLILRYWKSCCMAGKPGCGARLIAIGKRRSAGVRRRQGTIPARRGRDTASYRVRKGGGIGTSQKRGAKRRMCFL